jgi:hypothetical protein
MSDKSGTGDNEIDLALITLALLESDFDLDTSRGSTVWARNSGYATCWPKRKSASTRWREAPTMSRLAMRRLLADIRKGSRVAGS